jgi:hypothetical protein
MLVWEQRDMDAFLFRLIHDQGQTPADAIPANNGAVNAPMPLRALDNGFQLTGKSDSVLGYKVFGQQTASQLITGDTTEQRRGAAYFRNRPLGV